MILLVPLGFGFTYMMIKLAQESERKAKLAASKAPKKVAHINLSGKWLSWLIIALLAFQVYLNIAAYNAALAGMKNFNLFLTGLILIVFAGLFHVYRYAMSEAKKPPPPPVSAISKKETKSVSKMSTPKLTDKENIKVEKKT